MPIFQADLEQLEGQVICQPLPQPQPPDPITYRARGSPTDTSSRPQPLHHSPSHLTRKISEESIRTEFCDGPVLDSPRPATPEGCHGPDLGPVSVTSDRAELIDRLKRAQSPQWISSSHLEALFKSRDSHDPSSPIPSQSPYPPRSPSSHLVHSPDLLPPADITPEKARGPPKVAEVRSSDDEARLREGLNIQRPRSALHSGDFTQLESRSDRDPDCDADADADADADPDRDRTRTPTSPPRPRPRPFAFDRRPCPSYADPTEHIDPGDDFRSIPSSLSSSYSTSFAYKAPTTPLVQSESNEDLEPAWPRNVIYHPRRHTLTAAPSPLNLLNLPPRGPAAAALGGGLSAHRREGSLPYQAHQPRRSLTLAASGSPFLGTSPQMPALLRSRRSSISAESSSPLQHASMVGSYEESILRGRMSTTPSKPLDFVAQIGVLGLGKCKPSLKCPPHVTLPFPAVFYSYGNSSLYGRAPSEDGPSPYVGQIDLENGLPNQSDENRSRRKMQSRYAERRLAEEQTSPPPLDGPSEEGLDREPNRDRDRANRPRRGSGAPRAPPGGHYRIPEKGQIQIVIKNPNKTAVKLFLVPYDLAGMEPGTKTFIRQRSYSMGPVIEDAPVSEASTADRPILRYLVHLHICCPAKARFYLYKNIRIVFANRVPDGKEKLRNETTWPEPRFTAYKPVRAMHPPLSAASASASGPGAMLAAETAFRRRSSGFTSGHFPRGLEAMDGGVSPSPHDRLGRDGNAATHAGLRSPTMTESTSSSSSQPGSCNNSRPGTRDGLDAQIARYEKLSKGDVGYGGNSFAGASGLRSPGGAESLLSQRLRSLGVQGQDASVFEP
ncbi:hypothetical protein SODALDRAFT_311550 [Sodiomyces alkalinus F11]|uniref:Atos-like conserved domain-containing protein n=1 Tax=Sodiomyces alkalinus (strain CBS 110278 / VKM F-3762 / F11) TaxID=1314773 RepID=A0A3N2PVZ7_SODAK|nr:hypothetical protein SODALDRAFT_311550 [Sodiomyces alkalinus F11]ROT38658.1 hypothetical protein SODALDRAFT_311550 [Sodiomyces alkalinus F11]